MGGGSDGGSAGKLLGAPCNSAGQCASGFCVDGYCCGASCNDSICQRCDASSVDGVGHCGFAVAGSDLDKECASPAVTCSGQCNVKRTTSACTGTSFACSSRDELVAIPPGEVCVGNGGVPVSKTAYCNWGSDCTVGSCKATQWWTSCDGNGSCRPSTNNTDAAKETVYASAGQSLTASCGSGPSLCDNAKQCVADSLVNGHSCDGAGACITPSTVSCGNYLCDGVALQCKTQCSTTADCARSLVCSASFCHANWEWVQWNVTRSKSYVASTSTVADSQSGLIWQRDVGGFASGWRLPTKWELETLVDVSTSNPAIDSTAFPGTPSEPFWTSTLYASSGSGSAWLIYFYDGHSNYYGMPLSYRVRCVR